MKTLLLNLIAVLAIVGVYAEPANATLVIRSNPGGVVADFYRAVETYRMRGERVIVDGECASACTLLLSLARDGLVCATPRASFAFHRAYSGPPGTPAYEVDGGWSEIWMREMPEPVAQYIRDHGGLTHDWITLAGREMQARVPMCPAGTVKPNGESDVLRKKYTRRRFGDAS